ncbi:hypothetical protein FIBSPDRAFT_914554 [Athelia psychrophila]|uniref:NACHT domain-containing protein n=1 Tax=Athelia psychrophila TaxID=1759441 RepID=A0A167XET1_9AGAM|nr:hypothetical protein FIBSPDRAFT_914554 [Fibularhizoctonia sp. CBS 109695]
MDATSRPQCLNGTRTAILQSLVNNLTRAAPGTNVFWLHGMAGSGKSTIATTIAEQLHDRSQRGAFLFFDRNSPAQSGPDGVIRTLACQLALSNGVLREAICDAIEKDPQIATRTLDSQFKALVMAPLRSCSAKMAGPVVIILDAFDECGDDAQSRRALIHLLITNLPLLPHTFRFLITGRPELDLNNAFGSHPAITSVSLSAVEWSSAADVLRYIEHELDGLYQMRGRSDELAPGWPGQQRVEQFGSRAADSFIWAATGIRYLCAADDLDERLDRLLSQQAFSLGDLYATALRSASNWDPNEASADICRRVLGAVVVGRTPLSDDTMDSILGLESSKSSRRILRKLGCLLQWSEGFPVRTLHASFADYLTDAGMCGHQPWFIDKLKHHLQFTIGCLRVMKKLLCFNICGLQTSHLMNRDVQDLPDRIKTCIPQSLAYASRFWGEHLGHADTPDREVQASLLEFFQVSFLYWLEVLSLIGEGRAALEAMAFVRSHSKDHDEKVQNFSRDGIKFVSAFASIIADNAPHVYISALPFAPSTSIISQQYSVVIKNTLRLLTRLFHGHANADDHVASGSDDIRIWYARTGELMAGPFEGHTGRVLSLAFSPDDERVASSSSDNTICVWDARTGILIAGPFLGHSKCVNSVAFSPDGERIASGSEDNTIRIWDARTGKLVVGPIETSNSDVNSVAFSPDGERVASGSWDRIICIWDARTGKLVTGPLKGHLNSVRSVLFSPEGERIVSGSADGTIRFWDARTGECQCVARPFEGYSEPVNSVAFSPDGAHIASGSGDAMLSIWDARTGKLVAGPFTGHSDSYIVSGSCDTTVIIWDARTGELVAVAFSPDGNHVASGSGDRTIIIWDARTGKLVAGPLEGHSECINSVAFSPDGNCIASGSDDSTMQIWDAHTGKLVAGPFAGLINSVTSVAFSPDGDCSHIYIWNAHTDAHRGPVYSHVVSGSDNGTIYVWDARTVAFSPDGNHAASGSDHDAICIWDAHTGKLITGPFAAHSSSVNSIAFSPDGKHIISGSSDLTIHIWDARTGKLTAGAFMGHSNSVTSVAFSPDGERVASASGDGTIRIWGAHRCELVASSLNGHTDWGYNNLENGWKRNSPNELLFWVPPVYRTTLWGPDDIAIIGEEPTRLDLTHFVHGENWAQCHV